MARRRGNRSSDAPADAAAAPAPAAEDSAPDVADGAAGPDNSEQQAIEQMSVEELRAELAAARSELARLRAQLGKSTAAAAAPAPPPARSPDVQELHTKLQQLRQEQQEADAARDKAWKQLKAVVQEISGLANPDYLQSLVIKGQD